METRRPFSPLPQQNLAVATQRACEALACQTPEQLQWLGATLGPLWQLPVLHEVFLVEPRSGRVSTSSGQEVRPSWRILALHYLAIRARPAELPPEIVFADLPTARTYAQVYNQRTVDRLCGGVGREAAKLAAAARAVGGAPSGGEIAARAEKRTWELGFEFRAFPRFTLQLLWHAPDEEFPPSATILLPPNAEQFFCAEDLVVLSECLVSRLEGRPF